MSVIDPELEAQAIKHNIDDIRSRIRSACDRAGRDHGDVTLVAVTKTFPTSYIGSAREAGLADFGENRVQEFVEKAEAVAPRRLGGDVTWHMIGHLQRNKARDVIRYADVFHALDSRRLAKELHKRAEQEDRRLECFVQINVSGEASKFGLDPDELDDFLRDVAPYDRLDIRGLMTIALPVDDPEDVRPQFRLMRSLVERDRPWLPSHIRLEKLSMGMSGDFEVAIEEGATHVRIGSAIFGSRPPVG